MPVLELSASEWLSIISHAKKWLTNLRRAKESRKEESKEAIRAVITAIRKTTLYLRQAEQEGKSYEREEGLSMEWTRLSFKLEDLGLKDLARKCMLKGKYWADPKTIDSKTLERAEMKLSEVEALAASLLEEFSNDS
ncbi:hypothetical protein [Mariprofundus ferrooxydans]|uniref:Uncharacterized protein n=1 Tax=Mariprofundus ferrooxydans PV-1 TaxID=314345 RepID=Q0EWP8_9PROT|nr:hypothetical protein [Mariprofundus ferrooxydans]EAU53741.1 hypothetical protein SPV1_06364 [Mariprofundus ferrooxydans PV-1]